MGVVERVQCYLYLQNTLNQIDVLPQNKYMLKVNNRNTKRCEIPLMLTIIFL